MRIPRFSRQRRGAVAAGWVLLRLLPALIFSLIGRSGHGFEGPAQPPVGCIPSAAGAPGSYPHQQVCHLPVGEGGGLVWIFYPDAPRPPVANVVLFLHGYRATDPEDYGGWIDHLARSGNIVLYPVFEAARGDPPEVSEQNAFNAIRQALAYLQSQGPVRPSFDRFAVVGHSFGGGMAAQYAALAASNGLPVPKAVMAVMPGWQGGARYPAEYVSRIAPQTYMLVVDGDSDQFRTTRESTTIFDSASALAPDHKSHVRLTTGGALVADHYAALSPLPAYHLEQRSTMQERRRAFVKSLMHIRDGEINALDTQALWPMFDGLMALAQTREGIAAAVRASSLPLASGG
jgi:acetyl esterase/lipase